jgi:F420-dependent oxidoreductase-like protein
VKARSPSPRSGRRSGRVAEVRIGVSLPYGAGFLESIDRLPDFERAGASIVYIAEAYSFDAVSQLGYIAAKLPNIELASDILPIYTRTPALLAMTAAGLDHVSGGRFTLGIGSSGPQVIEGFHGVPYDAPIGRTRDVIQICRSVWRRDRLEYSNSRYSIPLTVERGGGGLGKPLKLINTPLRERIPIMVAAMGPRNVALTAELAEEWAPFFYHPESADAVWGNALRAGYAKRDPALGPLGIVVPISVAIGDDIDQWLEQARPQLALYIGGMGARGQNFYNDLTRRFGYEQAAEKIQDLYLDGKKAEAAAAVPADLIRNISLIGSAGFVSERIAALEQAGVSTLAIHPLGGSHAEQVRTVEKLADLIG